MGKKDTGYLYKAFMVARRPIIRLQRLAQQREDVKKNLVSNYGTFVGWLRSYPVGAQFIGAPPIYRPGARIDGPVADKEV